MRDWLAHRTASTPDSEALVAAGSGRTWSYEELDTAAEAMAGSLAALGLEAGDHLGVFVGPRIEYVTLVHAAMRLGIRLVPVSDRLTDTELRPRMEQADVTAILCGSNTEQRAVEATAEDDDDALSVPVLSLDDPQWERVAHLKSVDPLDVDPFEWDLSNPLLYLFTSGSTGQPKLVELLMSNVLSSAVSLAFRLGVHPDDRYLLTLSPHHTGGIMPLYRAVLAGTSLVVRTDFDPGGAADDIRTYDITGVSLVPTMLKQMLDARGTLADSLRVVLLGGAPASDTLIQRCRDYSIPVHTTYGMTEASSGITVATPQEAFDHLGTVGRPLLWTSVSVHDEAGEELPPGEIGEIVVDGPSITPGYYDSPEANEAAFGPHGLRTGDIGYEDERGYVYVLNRKDDRIITGGENVDPGEVVATLRNHSDVDDAAVVGISDDEWGEQVAALVVRENGEVGSAELETFCRERLAGYKLPRTIRFTEALPRTDTGSIKRPDVRERLAAAAEETIGDAETTADEPETTDTGSDSTADDPDVTGDDSDTSEGDPDATGDGSDTNEDHPDVTGDGSAGEVSGDAGQETPGDPEQNASVGTESDTPEDTEDVAQENAREDSPETEEVVADAETRTEETGDEADVRTAQRDSGEADQSNEADPETSAEAEATTDADSEMGGFEFTEQADEQGDVAEDHRDDDPEAQGDTVGDADDPLDEESLAGDDDVDDPADLGFDDPDDDEAEDEADEDDSETQVDESSEVKTNGDDTEATREDTSDDEITHEE
jgi:O-succinylbenzoic acid--CoA ligase